MLVNSWILKEPLGLGLNFSSKMEDLYVSSLGNIFKN
jgi:hypothetical protein